jgi:hypothetical protein
MSTKLEMEKYLDGLRQRQINFRDLTATLRSNDMPVANGWGKLLPKFKALPSSTDFASYLEVLKKLYRNHILYSERAVVVFQFPEGELASLTANIDSWVEPSSVFATNFPFPVEESTLKSLSSDPIYTKVVGKDGAKGGRTLVCCSKRYVRSREVIDYSDFPKQVLETLAAYDEIVGVRSRFVQAFDTLNFRVNDGQIILTIDLCGNLSLEDVGRAIIIHLEKLNACLAVAGYKGDVDDLRINFFPKIADLYSDPDGIVERIGHVTTSGSNKNERMRSKAKDLRHEPYHQEGLKAINGGTDLFSIGKRWDMNGYYIGVEIPGSHKQAGDPNAKVQVAIFEGCRSKADFSKVLDHLKL